MPYDITNKYPRWNRPAVAVQSCIPVGVLATDGFYSENSPFVHNVVWVIVAAFALSVVKGLAGGWERKT
jgi:hypothetical protein